LKKHLAGGVAKLCGLCGTKHAPGEPHKTRSTAFQDNLNLKTKTPLKSMKNTGFSKKASVTGSHFTPGLVSTTTIRHKSTLRI
jgi:hypothetical protein